MALDVARQKIVALDIGTNKIATIVAEVGDAGELEIIGIGTHQSRGLKKRCRGQH
jgi:cell division protein FtsA